VELPLDDPLLELLPPDDPLLADPLPDEPPDEEPLLVEPLVDELPLEEPEPVPPSLPVTTPPVESWLEQKASRQTEAAATTDFAKTSATFDWGDLESTVPSAPV
jgi:hypothetical protein